LYECNITVLSGSCSCCQLACEPSYAHLPNVPCLACCLSHA
jgi:hypothetical protein